MAAMLANASQGNEVIVIEPNYDAYEPVIFLAGGIPIRVRMMPPDDNHQTF
jgi:aspartate/methionine/tyrosine aminotransferase